MGVPSLIDLFDERNHAQLHGGILVAELIKRRAFFGYVKPGRE